MKCIPVAILACLITGLTMAPPFCAAQSVPTTPEEAYQIGMEAYVYFYPLVMMDVTRRQQTNVEAGKMVGRGPMNTFAHFREYPSTEFRDVVRPNFDTLYSTAWLDLSKEPLIVSVPDTAGRYYMLPMLDMWSDVFAVPGKRTSGTKAADYGIVAPGWTGKLPAEIEMLQAPTPYIWVVARTQTNGPSDYEAVHKVQDGYRVTPLSQWGKAPVRGVLRVDSTVDMKTPPVDQVNRMGAKAYFTYAAELMKLHPPHVTDWSMLARLRRIGMERGKSFVWENQDPVIQDALTRASGAALKAMYAKIPTIARVVEGWQMNTDTMGVYGNYYFKRAIIALIGLGANQCDDAVYPLNISDVDGEPLRGGNKYLLHFGREQLPPTDAFWSLTMYDAEGFQVANPINRYAIGNRDKLVFNLDGSLDLYIQHETPGPDKESNWLPAPATGTLAITLRVYAPRPAAIYGRWTPPPVQRVEAKPEPLPQ